MPDTHDHEITLAELRATSEQARQAYFRVLGQIGDRKEAYAAAMTALADLGAHDMEAAETMITDLDDQIATRLNDIRDRLAST